MLERGLFIVFVLVLSLGFVTAGDITIKTVPFHEVDIGIYRESGGGTEYLEIIPENSGFHGIVEVTYNNPDVSEVKISVLVEKDGVDLFNEKLGPYNLKEPIEIELFPEGYEIPAHLVTEEGTGNGSGEAETELKDEPVEETVSASAESKSVEEERSELSDGDSPEGSAGLTGNAVQGSSSGSGNYMYFIVAIVAIFGLLLLSLGYKIKKKGSGQVVQTQTPSEKQNQTSGANVAQPSSEAVKDKSGDSSSDVAISEVEKKIQEAEKNLKRLKEEVKIREMEKKIEQEKAELDRLKEGSKS